MKEESPSTDSRKNIDEENLSKGLRDVGLKAWSTVLGGFLVAMVTFGYTNAFGVYQDIYTRAGAASPSRISWIGSTQMFFLLAMSLPAGKLLDMGYFRQTTIAGSLLYVFSLFMVSIAHTDKYYQIFLSQGVGMGIGAGLIYLPAVAVQSRHWQVHRAFAMGVVTIGSSLGSIFFPIMLNQLFKNPSVGFEWGVRASAFLVLGLLVIGNLLMSDNQPDLSNRPKPDMKYMMTDVPYWLSILACILINMGLFFPYFYVQLFGIVHGVDENVAFYFLAILSAASLPGRLLPNIAADKFGPFNALIPCVGISGAMIFALYGTLNVGSLIAFNIIYGFFSGAYFSLVPPLVASLAKGPHEIGVRFGIAYALAGLGFLVGPPIDGQLIGTKNFDWSKAIIFSGVTVLSGFVLLIIVRSMQTRRKNTKLV
ncbi:hypothetical protein GYMLUDRAFT_46646 [Collybiopsis luxurians FD-317 M1]|uniref:Major facilitator superfamily (MFS) profile domain-containing protein n=1 Tax=Collybiopsis luxurians FD-317 M1 TaxID=944289 RepID=A0A0D0CFZ9_9AGAR|nr:hypothetical protein GYMLUDRAFT_46646 [Collybiopsis luxurians FD-317 M1]